MNGWRRRMEIYCDPDMLIELDDFQDVADVMQSASQHIEKLEAERDALIGWIERMQDALNAALADAPGWVSMARAARFPEPPQEKND